MNSRTKTTPGFTLIELMVVTVILGLLAAIAIPNFMSLRDRAKEASVKANMHSVQMAVENFSTIVGGTYPGDIDTRIDQVNTGFAGQPIGNNSLAGGVRVPPFPAEALLHAHQNFKNPFRVSFNVIDNNLVGGAPPPPVPAAVSGCTYYSSYEGDNITPGTPGMPACFYCITGFGKDEAIPHALMP
jgi:prepilin-type N-terminal cleavage/methylation domain-containing protein